MDGFAQYISRHFGEEKIYMTMINHPKLMFDYQFEMLAAFVAESRREYDIEFKTCSEAYGSYEREKLHRTR
jgi:hypothetical protein